MLLRAGARATVLCAFFASLAINGIFGVLHADWFALPAILGGWYLADAASGIVHMYMDYRPCRAGVGLADLYFYQGSRESSDYLDLRRRVMSPLGPMERLVFDFKNHHPRPDALGRRGLFTLTGSSILLFGLPASVVLNILAAFGMVPNWAIAGGTVMILGGALAQYFHASLHRSNPGAAIRLMRKVGLLMTPIAHEKHHASLRRDFATNNGWSNPLLNPVFLYLERRKILIGTGLEPT